ncbi:MAG: 2Fe-2S ferredoxin [Saprospiraceae bacterium]|jgi:2Fe-2S ferredoxin
MKNNVTITVINSEGEIILEAPNDLGLNLMEFLKASEYEQIQGTCLGIALCATCHVRVLESSPLLNEQMDEEFLMLETLPVSFENSRLSCQIPLNKNLNKISISIPN